MNRVARRDPFGIRPLYFARDGGGFVVTGDLAALLARGYGDVLDDDAVFDFLLFGQNLDPTTTTYARIGRVAPAHEAVFTAEGVTQRRYWTLPQVEARKITPDDAVAEFRDLFTRVVGEAAQAGRIALSLSGGVDSTMIAATLAEVAPGAVSAVATGYEHLVRDDDHRYAAIAARALGIPLHFLPSDGYKLFERWDDPHCRGLEPVETPLRAAFIDLMRLLGARGETIMTGQGGDAVLYASHGYFFDLLRRGRVDRVVAESLRYALTRRRLPPLLLRSRLLRALRPSPKVPPYPAWLRRDLRDRWREVWSSRRGQHPTRPEAAYLLQQPGWPNAFESYDEAWTGVPATLAVPFFDVRIVEFLFSLPPMPHFADKDIVRRAMAGRVPDEVRLRRKRPLGADAAEVLLRRDLERWLPMLSDSRMAPYVDARILSESVRARVREGRPLQQEMHAFALAMWLSYR
jgi:asparagine synthase (glutamine-hydrolysing)